LPHRDRVAVIELRSADGGRRCNCRFLDLIVVPVVFVFKQSIKSPLPISLIYKLANKKLKK